MDSPEERLARLLSEIWDLEDPELAGTPAAFLELLREFRGADTPPRMQPIAAPTRDLVVVRDVPFHSLCAHHLVPFFGTVDLAYVPDRRLAGLGWFPRIVTHHARRPQLQERLVAAICASVEEALAPRSFGVRLRARQMCLELRGPRSPATSESLALRGDPDEALRAALQGA